MAFELIQKLFLSLIGDGVSTTFTFPLDGILSGDDQYVMNTLIPSSAVLWNTTSPVPGVASISGSNLVLTFDAPWSLGQIATVQVDLHFDSGITNPAGNVNTDSPGSPSTINPTQIAGVDNTGYVRRVLTTPGGALIVSSETSANDVQFSVDTGQSPTLISSVAVQPIISITPQLAATSIAFVLTGLDIWAAPAVARWQLIKNGTLSGSVFADVPGSNAQVDTSASSVTGGMIMDSGYTYLGTRTNTYQLNFAIPGGVPDIFTLTVAKQTSGPISQYCNGALRWTEQTQAL